MFAQLKVFLDGHKKTFIALEYFTQQKHVISFIREYQADMLSLSVIYGDSGE